MQTKNAIELGVAFKKAIGLLEISNKEAGRRENNKIKGLARKTLGTEKLKFIWIGQVNGRKQ